MAEAAEGMEQGITLELQGLQLAVSLEQRLKRFLYTSSEFPGFFPGNVEFHNAYAPGRLQAIQDILQIQKPELFIDVINHVNNQKLIPRQETLFVALALAAHYAPLQLKLFETLLHVINSSEDLFMFVKFYTTCTKKSFCSGINKVIASYYNNKDPLELAREVGKARGYHFWTHKDLIRIAYSYPTSTQTAVIIEYILNGLERAKIVAEGNYASTEVIDILTKFHELKHSNSETRIAELVKELGCTNINHVPQKFQKSRIVWEALIPLMPLQDLIIHLVRLFRLRLLQSNTFQEKVIAQMTNNNAITTSQMHPIEIFIAMNNFKMGGKRTDINYLRYLKRHNMQIPKRNRPQCNHIMKAFRKTMALAFQNVQPTGKSYFITIEVGEKMRLPCFGCKNISCFEAEVMLILSFLRIEDDVTVAVFNNDTIHIVELPKYARYDKAFKTLREAPHGYVMVSSVFDFALARNKPIDVFINLYAYQWWHPDMPDEIIYQETPVTALKKYKDKMGLPNTKLITVLLIKPPYAVADGSENILDIYGFSKETPKVIEAFSRGLFN